MGRPSGQQGRSAGFLRLRDTVGGMLLSALRHPVVIAYLAWLMLQNSTSTHDCLAFWLFVTLGLRTEMPDQKSTKLIVLAAFDADEEGNLLPAFDPRQMQDEGRAVREAKAPADKHVAVVAWSRDADPVAGEYGEPVELFRHGEVPELE